MVAQVVVFGRRDLTDVLERRARLAVPSIPRDVYWISVRDPDEPPIWPRSHRRLLKLAFWDYDTAADGGCVANMFERPHAARILRFLGVMRADAKARELWINCEAGLSRSMAIAEFVVDHVGLDFRTFAQAHPVRYPNGRVKQILVQTAREGG